MDKKLQVMELWRRNFQDTETFIQFYFSRKYSDNHALVYEKNGKVLSAFLMLPYPINWQDISLETAYISGACTLKEARNHGYMSSLLKKAFQKMYKRGIALSTLIPAEKWLFEYYEKLGYVPVFDYSTEIDQIDVKIPINPTLSIHSPSCYDPRFAESVYSYFEQKMQTRNCCIQHPKDDYQAIIEETYLSGGRLATVCPTHCFSPTGWALAIPTEGVIRIKECFYDTIEEKKALLQYFSKLWQTSRIECRTLPQKNNFRHFGMARITNAGIMLQQIAHLYPSLSIAITLHDSHLAENEGTYILSQGKCKKVKKIKPQTDLEADIPMLTKTLLGYHSNQSLPSLAKLLGEQIPFMNLMME